MVGLTGFKLDNVGVLAKRFHAHTSTVRAGIGGDGESLLEKLMLSASQCSSKAMALSTSIDEAARLTEAISMADLLDAAWNRCRLSGFAGGLSLAKVAFRTRRGL
jgi:hypothetical protein